MMEAISAVDIALSGLKAQRARMNVIASNIANAFSTRTPNGGAYRRQMVVFRGEQLTPTVDPSKYGVRVKRIATDVSPLRTVYRPGHPDANADGYVQYPNVDLAVEMVDLVSAQRAYEANVSVVVSHKRMIQNALEIIRA